MLRYFRINDPYRLVGVLVITVIIYLPLLLDSPSLTYPELKSMIIGEKVSLGSLPHTRVADHTGPVSMWVDSVIEFLFGRSLVARHIMGVLIIFFQSAYLGIMFIDKKVFGENTFIPSLIFSVLFLFSFDTWTLSSDLMGSGFLLLALDNLFKEIEFRVQRDETIFNLGVFISMASLCNFAFSVYLAASIVILLVYTRTSGRKYLLAIFGFLLPHLILICIYYLNGTLEKFWNYYYLANLGFNREALMSGKGLFILTLLPIIYLAVSLFMLNREARFSKYQSQLLQSVVLWTGFSFLYILLAKDQRPQNLIVFIPCFSFFFTHFLLMIRRKKFAEINLWLFLLGVVTTSYLARYGKLESINYERMFVKTENQAISNKKILVLENDLSLYAENSLATKFLNWDLSRDIFEHPEYYDNITEVYEAFRKDMPQVIVDPNHVMDAFWEKMPGLKRRYKKVSDGVYRLI
ncbi:MAG: hypothetical protein ACOYXT_20950 [Bacteroidota bacterium]